LSVANSDISHASLNLVSPPGAEHQAELLDSVPNSLEEAFRVPHDGVSGVYKPVVSQGLLISNDAHTVTATNADGSTAWTYTRDNVEICSLATAWNRVRSEERRVGKESRYWMSSEQLKKKKEAKD